MHSSRAAGGVCWSHGVRWESAADPVRGLPVPTVPQSKPDALRVTDAESHAHAHPNAGAYTDTHSDPGPYTYALSHA